MSDLVNDFFRQHYPPDWDEAWEQEHCVQSYAKRYKGAAGHGATIFPRIVCADGLSMSVQGHFGAYSHPRDDFADRYTAVEILGPRINEFMPYQPGDCGEEMIYGYVPVAVVVEVIEKHGGLQSAAHGD